MFTSPAAADRLARAEAWLQGRGPAEEILVVAASTEAAHELLRAAAAKRGAAFGWYRATLGRLAAELAAASLAARALAPLGRLGCVAVVARVVQELEADALGRYRDVATAPSFARAAASALEELRLAKVDADALATVDPGLAALQRAYVAALADARLIDRAGVFELAAELARDRSFEHPLLGLPVLLVDVALSAAAEVELVCALADRAPELCATSPYGDERSLAQAVERLHAKVEPAASSQPETSLSRLQTHLFEDRMPPRADVDASVSILSAPGESRECVEIVRRLLEHAGAGIPFDRMAVLLRSMEEYRPHLEEALQRAGIPAYFARGARRPDPAGRALVSLLACREENFSARRFAEYLSLGEVPDATAQGEPPPAPESGERWVAPDEELVTEAVADALAPASLEAEVDESRLLLTAGADPMHASVTDGTLRAPRRWERLLVEAAVIGGRDRWQRRLDALALQLRMDREELDLADDSAAERIDAKLDALASLRGYALPLLAALAELPARATWGEWLDALSALATRSLRRPARVLSVLSELAPMAEVGPVDLAEVRLVLATRLLELSEPSPASRHGRVFVAATDAARGLVFDVVAIPGLAERLFPRKISEEPLLLDRQRQLLAAGLETNLERVAGERLALRVAAGAARRTLLLSYPRLDLDQARPRVPSFYALEALRAAEGKLPGFDELAARAERISGARVGWPAPDVPERAIDAAEHDLALLQRLLTLDEKESAGTARYLLAANPHLGRALRFRARRWLPGWTEADGLLPPVRGELAAGAREAMASQRLSERSYSATALQHFASCPYRFFLSAVQRLAPREEPEAIDEMDALQRGSLVHEVQFELFGRLEKDELLPVTPENLDSARPLLESVLDAVAARYRDELAPAIDRVWEDGVAAVRADLREWLQRMSDDDSGYVPWRFELAFGLAGRRERDPHSVPDPVPLDCGIQLRGSIDLVERRQDGALRVTDHKTGRRWVEPGDVIAGGTSLQPVLYALATEKLFPKHTVRSGRLYYCTSAGGFEESDVPLGAAARAAADLVARVVDAALEQPFLPAAPAPQACRFCDYQLVCGPYEELRTGRKRTDHEQLEALQTLREAP